MKLILPKKINCMIPENAGACAAYAQSECFRLLKKLGISASITGYNKELTLNLGTDDRIPASVMKKVCNNGFVSSVTKSGVTLAAKTEKGRGCFNCSGKFSARSKMRNFQTSNAEWQKILENSPGVLKKFAQAQNGFQMSRNRSQTDSNLRPLLMTVVRKSANRLQSDFCRFYSFQR